MLDNPLDFYSAVENGNLIQLSPAMFEFLRKQTCTEPCVDQFLYHTTNSDAVMVWKDIVPCRVRYYARQLYTVLYDRECGGSIVTTYVGNPIDVAPHPYAFACLEFQGQLEDLGFLKRYRFNNLGPVRKFIRYCESDLRTSLVSAP